ncbi:glutamine-hydrolyzing carbamoyl-phosphate synthase small subunit [Thermicanus aegyptius]|uniref:glutamine-hydrolyzing carbamoyl-phosphate synthase small subunit n=1 Tax=Thermicanus aegyptius TaxID=94009 RepID=UPI0004293CB2|nr:glutamine-hydrolyzing carbamoyl-phosphate synthase small subunit [Thermicanus aegyptius]
MRVKLVLEDGTTYHGGSFGYPAGETVGEVVFNTGMTGYQEVLSDPSYCGQIVTMTYPLIGNYGLNREDFESLRPQVKGFIVREFAASPSNWRSEIPLDEVLKTYRIPGIYGVDTRKLTRKIRYEGTMKGAIVPEEMELEEVFSLLAPPLPRDQVRQVSTRTPYRIPGEKERILLIDYGAKGGILRELSLRGCEVIVAPYNVSPDEIRQFSPDGILLSNGPGDPADLPEAIGTVRAILGEYPLFGICLGHQIFSLACGAKSEKMKFGHRGSNQPVKDLITGRVYITSQNHGYTILPSSLEGTELILTHRSMNDDSVEGVRHSRLPAFSVQYHPEASPGPQDSTYLFDQFLEMVREEKGKREGELSIPKRNRERSQPLDIQKTPQWKKKGGGLYV